MQKNKWNGKPHSRSVWKTYQETQMHCAPVDDECIEYALETPFAERQTHRMR